jgi:Tol biopolymer transport system component
MLAFYDANARGYRVLTLETGGDVVVLNESSLGMSFSHDSRALVYADVRELDQLYAPTLFVTQLGAGSQPKPLLDNPESEEQPAWSPDGGWVAFGHRSFDLAQGYASQLALLNLYTGEVVIPSQDPDYTNSLFTWDPSGQRVLMQRFRMGDASARPELWAYDLPTGAFTVISQDAISGRWMP